MEKDKDKKSDKVKMKRVSGTTRYIDFNTAEEGDVLADGWYVGEVDGKYGMQHEFKELDGGLVVVGGGHLNYLVEKHLNKGTRCRVLFDGHEVMAKGKFSGKAVKKFALELEDVEPVVVEDESLEEAPPWVEEKPKTKTRSKTTKETKAPTKTTKAPAKAVEEDDDMFGDL